MMRTGFARSTHRDRFVAGIALAGLVTALLAATPAGAATTVLSASFDDGTTTGLAVAATAPDAVDVVTGPGRTDRSARITSSSERTVSLHRYGSWTGKLTLTASFYAVDTSHRRQAFLMHTTVSGVPRYQSVFAFNPTGGVDLAGAVTQRRYEARRWYALKAVVDHGAGTVDGWIDGEQVIDDRPLLADATWSTTQSVRFTQTGRSGSTAVAYLDDVRGVEDTAADLPGQVGGWNLRTYTPTAPTFSADGSSLVIAADKGVAGSFRKEHPVTPGRAYGIERTVVVTGAGSGTTVKLVATALSGGEPLTGVPDAVVESVVQRGNTVGSVLPLHFRAAAGADSVRIELYAAGPGTVRFDAGELSEKPTWQDLFGRYASSRVAHPVEVPEYMFGTRASWNTINDESLETKKSLVEPLVSLNPADLAATARAANVARASLAQHPEIERHVRRIVDVYRFTGESRYADAAITVLTALADSYLQVPYRHGGFMTWLTTLSIDAVYAYDLVYDAPGWTDARRTSVENWIRTSVPDEYNLNGATINNITPYGLKHVLGAAVILGDPDMVRLFVPMVDALLSGRFFHSDGFWEEATVSYQEQVQDNLTQLFTLLQKNFVDPPGYVDTGQGLRLDHTDLGSRYLMFARAPNVTASMRQPNGQVIPINDTWAGPGNLSPYTHTDPVKAEHLKDIALNGYGFYALTRGDARSGPYGEATQITLDAPQIARGLPYAGGHSHGSHLGISLWGSGVENLPLVGYASQPAANRYFHMNAVAQNVPWVWDKDAGPYGDRAQQPTHASILGIDTGERNDNRVQFVEASLPGPDGDGARMKRRLVMLVAVDGGRSYAVDVSRLQGGDAHQLFLRANEQEDTELRTTLPVVEHTGTVKDYLTAAGRAYGLADFRDLMRSPRTADGSGDFDFTWRSLTSDTSMRAFMNGLPGDEVIFSRIPTNRRTLQKPELKDSFPGEHFQRLTKVHEQDTTLYGAVYDTWREGQTPSVRTVRWLPAPDGDPMTTVAKVETAGFTDYIYFSDDLESREIDGITFRGRVSTVRVAKATGKIAYVYTYGGGSVTGVPGAVSWGGSQHIATVVTAATTAHDGSPVPPAGASNTITVAADLPQGNALDGHWLRVRLGDGSGWAFEIEKVLGRTVEVEGWLPFALTAAGARRLFAPFKDQVVPGPVSAEIDTSHGAVLGPFARPAR